MKIPTPNLIKELRQTVKYRFNWFGNLYIDYRELKRLQKLMSEAAVQLEWFLKQHEWSSKHENSQSS